MLEPHDDGGVVIGVGSPLMGDDGLGLVALEALREQWSFEPHLELLDGGTWGMNLLPFIESARRVLIIDAVHGGGEAGSFIKLERADIPRFFALKLSPHQIDLKEVLALAELRGNLPEQTVVLGLEPAVVEMSASLSLTVAEGIPRLVDEVVDHLEGWGYDVRPRESGGR
jgi:hydrogenase maturation protease